MQRHTVLITGTSSGLGRSLARRLAADGHLVIGTSRHGQEPIPGVRALRLDVTSDAAVAACVAEAEQAAGGIDVLINNAGRLDEGALEEFSAADLQAVFDVNVFGAVRMINALLPAMRGRGRGRIVNVSSLAGVIPAPFMGAYCASKHALEAYTESLRYELAPLGLHVSLVEPSHFRSPMSLRRVRRATLDAYEPWRRRVFAAIDRDEAAAPDETAAVDRIVRLLQTPRPRLRHVFGPHAGNYRLRGVVPEWLWESGVRKTFGL